MPFCFGFPGIDVFCVNVEVKSPSFVDSYEVDVISEVFLVYLVDCFNILFKKVIF